MSQANIASWFATPIATVRVTDHASLNQALEALFLEKERAGDAFRHEVRIPTQIGPLFESRFDLFDWRDPPVQQLAEACHDALYDLVQTLNGYDEDDMASFTFYYESWFHITRNGGYQSIHYHPGASWSGIYAVRTGDTLADRPESGQVKFYDPRGASFMHVDEGNRRTDPRFSATPVYLSHEEGQLVLFPSWLMHEVLPYVGQTERIVVAFNTAIRRTTD